MTGTSLPTPTLHSSACVLRYWDAPPWSERVRAERFITACRQMAQEGTGARLAVDRVSGGAFIGWCSLNRWNPDYRSASLGYCFDDAAWGHGYATEAARGLLRWAFSRSTIAAEASTPSTAIPRAASGSATRPVPMASSSTRPTRARPARNSTAGPGSICPW